MQHAPYLDRVLAGEEVTFEFPSLKIADSYRQANLVPDVGAEGEVKGFYVMTFDITGLKRAEKSLLELSRIDTLTQLPNRRRFREKLDEALARSQRSGRAMGLMYLDVDYFKRINDTYGHGVGDEVLIGFARRLQANVRTTDTVARLSGDEFVIILEGLHDPDEAGLVASKIVAAMQEPLALQDHELKVTSSIGVAVVDAIERDHESAFMRLNTLTATELIARADQALYAAKGAGRNGFAVLDA